MIANTQVEIRSPVRLRRFLDSAPRLRSPVRLRSTSAPNLLDLVVYWCKCLRLLDWRIDIRYVKDLCAADGRPVFGLCRPLVDNKSATILVRDPSTPPEGYTVAEAIYQVEETIVHELLHLHFAAFGTQSPAEIAAEEQAVWSIAEALIAKKGTGEEYRIARAMIASVNKARQARARQARKEQGTTMDKEQIKQAIEALKSGNGDAALSVLEALLTEAAGGDAAPPGGSEPGDPGGADDMAANADPEDPNKPGDKPGDKGRRARQTEADRHVSTLARNVALSNTATIRLMLHTAKTIDGIDLPAVVETEILKCRTVEDAEARLRIARAMIATTEPANGQRGAAAAPPAGRGAPRVPVSVSRSRSGAEPPAGQGEGPKLSGMQAKLKATLDRKDRADLADRVRPRKIVNRGA